MFTALMTAAAVTGILAYALLGYVPRVLVLVTVVCFLIVVF